MIRTVRLTQNKL